MRSSRASGSSVSRRCRASSGSSSISHHRLATQPAESSRCGSGRPRSLRRERGDRVGERLHDVGMTGRRRDDTVGSDRLGRGDPEAVAFLARGAAELEALAAAAADGEDPRLGAVDVDQLGQRSRLVELHRVARGPRFAARAQRDDAERRALAQAPRDEVEIARLEDPEIEQPVGKEDRAQRKERQLGHGRTADQPAASSSRWRTSVVPLAANAAASRSANQTERCWPPVQPIATVR